jgi:probable HAF family extracellular repeat protein
MKKSVIATVLIGLLIGVGTGQANASGYSFTDLGTLGGKDSQAWGINNSGPIARYSYFSVSGYHATIPFIRNGYAISINNSGQVVGASEISDLYPVPPTLWSGTTQTDLGTLGGYSSGTNDSNDSSQVAGYFYFLGTYFYDPSLYGLIVLHDNIQKDLGQWDYSVAAGINNSGQVAGYSYFSGIGNYHATIWNGATPTDLGTLGGSYSWAIGINNSGQVVGGSTTFGNATWHATIWNDTTPTDLNDLLTVSEVNAGWILQAANGINDNGWIIGSAHNSITGLDHAFLLTPVPEPETYAMFMAGLGLMGFIARRRRKNGQA